MSLRFVGKIGEEVSHRCGPFAETKEGHCDNLTEEMKDEFAVDKIEHEMGPRHVHKG